MVVQWLQHSTGNPKVDDSIRDGVENFIIQSKFSWFKLPDSDGKRYQFSTGFLGG